jgi:phage tail protein X
VIFISLMGITRAGLSVVLPDMPENRVFLCGVAVFDRWLKL